jgi:uncharacterized membrane protein YeaQ/YmgE (transglycosylase-associated protein family)
VDNAGAPVLPGKTQANGRLQHLPPSPVIGDDGRIGARIEPFISSRVGERTSPTNEGRKTMSLIIFLVVGLIAGALASYIMGRQQDLLINLLIGIIGAVVGGFLAGLLGIAAYGLLGEIIVATLGAVLCIWVWQRIR